jgi:hypothetical protein
MSKKGGPRPLYRRELLIGCWSQCLYASTQTLSVYVFKDPWDSNYILEWFSNCTVDYIPSQYAQTLRLPLSCLLVRGWKIKLEFHRVALKLSTPNWKEISANFLHLVQVQTISVGVSVVSLVFLLMLLAESVVKTEGGPMAQNKMRSHKRSSRLCRKERPSVLSRQGPQA